MLEPRQSRLRQKRLCARMVELKLDAVVVGAPAHVYYFSTYLTHWLHQSGFVLFNDGTSWLTTPNTAALNVAADETVSFEAQWNATLRQEQPQVVAGQIQAILQKRRAKHIAVDASPVTSQLALLVDANIENIEPTLWQLRRQKDADELALLKVALRAADEMFAVARQIIRPGVTELEIYTQLHQAAVMSTCEPMSGLLGNDFTSGGGGGMPRAGKVAEAGEIYVLDLGPSYRGYFADSCRSFVVDGAPTDAQYKAAEAIEQALKIVETLARPGASGVAIYAAVDEHFKQTHGRGMTHHLGHGIGLQPHEYPHLNPMWNDVLLEDEIFVAEPGLYGQELSSGLRMENAYRITHNGVEKLLQAPLAI